MYGSGVSYLYQHVSFSCFGIWLVLYGFDPGYQCPQANGHATHMSHQIDKILNWFERLQRMREGQPLPPQADVKLS